jgi:hypothetical protein
MGPFNTSVPTLKIPTVEFVTEDSVTTNTTRSPERFEPNDTLPVEPITRRGTNNTLTSSTFTVGFNNTNMSTSPRPSVNATDELEDFGIPTRGISDTTAGNDMAFGVEGSNSSTYILVDASEADGVQAERVDPVYRQAHSNSGERPMSPFEKQRVLDQNEAVVADSKLFGRHGPLQLLAKLASSALDNPLHDMLDNERGKMSAKLTQDGHDKMHEEFREQAKQMLHISSSDTNARPTSNQQALDLQARSWWEYEPLQDDREPYLNLKSEKIIGHRGQHLKSSSQIVNGDDPIAASKLNIRSVDPLTVDR